MNLLSSFKTLIANIPEAQLLHLWPSSSQGAICLQAPKGEFAQEIKRLFEKDIHLTGIKGDWDLRISDLVKSHDGTDIWPLW